MSGRPCTLDASFLLTLGKAGRLDLLARARSFEWCLTPLVRSELQSPETRDPVDRAVLDGTISLTEVDSDQETEMDLFAEWSEKVDSGEAEAIAVALARNWLVGIEDRQAQRLLDRLAGAGRWTNCAAVLWSLVKGETMTLAEADVIFASLDVYAGYQRRGIISLMDMVSA